eukprot:2496479-Alexandrium_andersonii.AAC.1
MRCPRVAWPYARWSTLGAPCQQRNFTGAFGAPALAQCSIGLRALLLHTPEHACRHARALLYEP